MAIVNQVRLAVMRTVSMGDEFTTVEATVTITRDNTTDTPEDMEEMAIQEARIFLESAVKDFQENK